MAAFVLSFLGGLFVVVGTTLGYVLYAAALVPSVTGLTMVFAAVAVSLGLLILVFSGLLYLRPGLHVAWGVVILAFAVGSFTSAFSGYAGLGLGVIGMVLAIVGGSLAIAWRHGGGVPGMGVPAGPYRVCQSCGRATLSGYAFCPFCGAAAVSAPAPGAPPIPPR